MSSVNSIALGLPLSTGTFALRFTLGVPSYVLITKNERSHTTGSRVAQWERAGPITQRSMDRNHSLLLTFFFR